MSYEEMLNSAFEKIKPIESSGERFEIPNATGSLEGKKTIITNFKQICAYIRRDEEHVLKFLLRELATSGAIKGDRLILQRRILASQINQKIKDYCSEFVICKECGKPDTQLMKQDSFLFIHCLACGAKHSVRAKI